MPGPLKRALNCFAPLSDPRRGSATRRASSARFSCDEVASSHWEILISRLPMVPSHTGSNHSRAMPSASYTADPDGFQRRTWNSSAVRCLPAPSVHPDTVPMSIPRLENPAFSGIEAAIQTRRRGKVRLLRGCHQAPRHQPAVTRAIAEDRQTSASTASAGGSPFGPTPHVLKSFSKKAGWPLRSHPAPWRPPKFSLTSLCSSLRSDKTRIDCCHCKGMRPIVRTVSSCGYKVPLSQRTEGRRLEAKTL